MAFMRHELEFSAVNVCVEMPCCGFVFAADHKDDNGSDVETWSCPNCQAQGAVDLDDPKVIETLARVIENRHGTLHGIGDTLREALAELKRGQ